MPGPGGPGGPGGPLGPGWPSPGSPCKDVEVIYYCLKWSFVQINVVLYIFTLHFLAFASFCSRGSWNTSWPRRTLGKKSSLWLKILFSQSQQTSIEKKKNLQLCRPLQDRPKTRSTVNIWSKERKFWTHLKMSTHRFSVSSWRSCRTVRSWWSRWSDWSWYLLHNRAVPKADHLSCRARRTFRPRRPLSPSFPFVARVTKPRTALERKEKNKSKMYFSGSNLFL